MSLQNKTFNELITFTRATGGGRFNAQGQYEWLSADQPRFDFDPSALEPKGILVEEQRTNLLLRSAEFDNSYWDKTRINISTDAAVAPDGEMVACKLVESTETGTHTLRRSFTFSVRPYTVSFFAKAAERSVLSLLGVSGGTAARAVHFNLLTGTLSYGQVALEGAESITPMGGGWYRCSVTFTPKSSEAGGAYIDLRLSSTNTPGLNGDSYTGDGASGIYIWGAQLEAGAFPTSYIPTTTAQVTRAADLCSVDTLSPWYRADEGTLLVDWNLPVNTSDNNQLAAFGSAVASSMAIRMGVNNGRRVRAFAQDSAAVFQYSVDCPVEASRTTGKSAFVYKLKDDFAASSAGSLNKDVSGDISSLSVDALRVGNNSGSYANGHIRRIRYIPRRVSDTELQALTAL